MRSKLLNITIGCCAVFFCAASVFAQYDTCTQLKYWEHKSSSYTDTAFYRKQYDSIRAYVELCAGRDNESSWAFSYLDNSVQLMSRDTSRYDTYRAWLISVLYLNTKVPEYFCNCLGSIADTYIYGKYAVYAHFAVLNYMRQSGKCGWDSIAQAAYMKDSAYDANHGYDLTHLPPLDSLDLGFLLKSNVKEPVKPVLSSDLASFTSSPDPFRKETTLEFTLNRMSYVTLAVYDELGRLVWGDGKGTSLEAGTHVIHLDGSSLPSGTLYARIARGFGEVKTVKLVHEK